ncbi:TKL family protein kinase [Tritrichomonas foetus]|uniref:TKL family protein kinase n=1 Tax=Tritrichomonas foetus TaxID=1144522 RepID=A0A1J4KB96_9EUKA|nr:TKL family protein kinase [Tritrichomonas foetus]|eukprot:OHT08687.1 TKL family protein kinase [Tritrichomonas foetus]
MITPRSVRDCVPEFEQSLHDLENLCNSCAVHQKKFVHSTTQFQKFIDALKINAKSTEMTNDQLESYRFTGFQIQELISLMAHHQFHCWEQVTLEMPINSVADQLTSIAKNLRKNTKKLDSIAYKYFIYDEKDWMDLHILDLKMIYASFSQYISKENAADYIVSLMKERLNEIDTFLDDISKLTKNPSLFLPGVRVFSPIPIDYQNWRINYSDLKKIRLAGSGASASVYYGLYNKINTPVAIKVLNYDKLDGQKLISFQREVSILNKANHPSLLRFIGATDTPPYCIVTEWMPNDNLYQEINFLKRLDQTMRTIAAFDIARGMQYLHSKHIIHRDLKSLNVLLDKDNKAHICDFGYSKTYEENCLNTVNIGTPHWMAPELMITNETQNKYSFKIDVYAYGILLWEITSGSAPYVGLDPRYIQQHVKNDDLRPIIPFNTPDGVRNLIERCWDRNPDLRPTFDEIVNLFQRGEIILNGANKETFMNYVQTTLGDNPVNSFEDSLSSGSDIEEIVTSVEKNGLPESKSMIQKCWDKLESYLENENCQFSLISRVIEHFLNSFLKNQVASALRKFPKNSIDEKIMQNIAEMIPSGSDEFDDDIVIASCKNGAADVIAVYAVQQKHIKLAFEAVAKQGVDISLKAAVADRCVQQIYSNDPELVCAALRCLVGIGEGRRFTDEAIRLHISNENLGIRNCVYVAIIAAAMSGLELPIDIADSLIGSLDKDENAMKALIAMCQIPQIAIHVVNRLTNIELKSYEVLIKILLLIAQNKGLKMIVEEVLDKIDFDKIPDNLSGPLLTLKMFAGMA